MNGIEVDYDHTMHTKVMFSGKLANENSPGRLLNFIGL